MMTAPAVDAEAGSSVLNLDAGWELLSTESGACAEPASLAGVTAGWRAAAVPGTVATSLAADIDQRAPYDEQDWWYRTRFAADDLPTGAAGFLHFGGLATIAEVWLNGIRILSSTNMHLAHRVEVTPYLRADNLLVIAFRALRAATHPARPRARWRTALVDRQELRWFRTTLLGRMPGWTPPVDPVGPWRPVCLEICRRVVIDHLHVRPLVQASVNHVEVDVALRLPPDTTLDALVLHLGGETYPIAVAAGAAASQPVTVRALVETHDRSRWWPHTHGRATLVPWHLEVRSAGVSCQAGEGSLGFRELELYQTNGRVQIVVNSVPVFCRGACWISADILALQAAPARLRHLLTLARDAGVNMLRISGTATYESDAFYALCDELGILVWQDFMFANFDYPFDDARFRADVDAEIAQQVNRLKRHACIAMYCGGSEVAQQAAMMGLPRTHWMHPFYVEQLPAQLSQLHPGVPYFPSSPWGGALPFHAGTGICHYYGVGAYLRPLADVRSAGVKFASECLGFSNVPDSPIMEQIGDGRMLPPHHPRWKARQPRDNGAGWDFEDVRDHYHRLLLDQDPVALRSADVSRYYELARLVPGEVMRRVFAEWRDPARGCGGALVWIYADLVPGAGWGVIDSTGQPKSTYWYLKRAWARRSISLLDDGLDGLAVLLSNETARAVDAALEIDFLMRGSRTVATTRVPVQVEPHGNSRLQVDALLGYFTDSTYAYRFGPPSFDCVTARLVRPDSGKLIASDFFFPGKIRFEPQPAEALQIAVVRQSRTRVLIEVRADRMIYGVRLEAPGYVPGDNHFHVAPGECRRVLFTRTAPSAAPLQLEAHAVNIAGSVQLQVSSGLSS